MDVFDDNVFVFLLKDLEAKSMNLKVKCEKISE